jgi:hypothetical protein
MTALHGIRSVLPLAAASATILQGAFAGNVLVVDPRGGGDFFRVQGAVDAASDGDTILVKSGLYPAFTINDKGVTVIADTGQNVSVVGPVRVMNLAADQDVLLVGLLIVVPIDYYASDRCALRLIGNAGSVRVEQCSLQGESCGQGYCSAGDGSKLEQNAEVVFTRCELLGGSGGIGGWGMYSWNSRVAAYDSRFQGGSGGNLGTDTWCDSPHGGIGAYLGGPQSAFLLASGSAFLGGDGGTGGTGPNIFCECGNDAGSGGAGLASSVANALHLLDGTFSGGHAGPIPGCVSCCSLPGGGCCPGTDGYGVGGSGVVYYPGVSRRLGVENPQREHSTIPVRVEGSEGDQAYLFMSSRTTLRFVSGYRGVQLTQQPGPPIFLGTLDWRGKLDSLIRFPELGVGAEAGTFFLQAATRDQQGQWTFSSPVSLVVLDQAL